MDMASDLFQTSNSKEEMKDQTKNFKWQPPPLQAIKVNVDATFITELNCGATGVVIRNDQAQFMAASCRWSNDLPDVLTAEAYACWDGATLACNLNMADVIIESDSQELVSLWKTRGNNRSYILPVLNQIEELCRNFVHFDICHVRREANMAAHYTAKFASPSNPSGS